MSGMKAVKVLRTVRVAESGNFHGREIVKDTDDHVPSDLFETLAAAGYVEARVVEDAPPATSGFSKMNKAALEAYAADQSIDISGASTKAEIVAAIEAAEAARG